MEENRISKRVLYMNLETTRPRVDQEIDGWMMWGRMEEWSAERSGRKKCVTGRNGRGSWERQGITAFCTCQWIYWLIDWSRFTWDPTVLYFFFLNKIVQLHLIADIWTVTVGITFILFLLWVPQNKLTNGVKQHYRHYNIKIDGVLGVGC